ncbi:MAG: hypothetical protein Q9195_008523 [Heterodermia aff. obscurata]
MDPGISFPEIEMNNLKNPSTTGNSPSISGLSLARPPADDSSMISCPGRDEDGQSRRMSHLSDIDALLPTGTQTNAHSDRHQDEEPKKIAMDGRLWVAFLYCIPHAIPLAITIIILYLNVRQVYWQDLGYPRQSSILQALQYAAKAHELMMAASLAAIVVHRIQHDLSCSGGVPFGFLTAGFRLDDPSFVFTKDFLGGALAPSGEQGLRRLFPLTYLLVLAFVLTSIVGPSSAVAMIPRLSWWDVPKIKAFGPDYTDMLFFNRTEEELWPAEITNSLYADISRCGPAEINQDCAIAAMDVVKDWTEMHQNQGTKPNITIFQDYEVTRFLTSEGGPPDNSSWTVTSTVGSIFARDLNHYWDWLVENSTLPTNIKRPLLRPAFLDPEFKVKKPHVQVQCHTYLDPDFEHDAFAFPHDNLLTPPLDTFKTDLWGLPNKFVMKILGDDPSVGDPDDTTHPYLLFDWFDTASNFSDKGAPSLGAVIIYAAWDGAALHNALATCSFDGRWAPVEYFLDPRDTNTIRQDSARPMDMLNCTNKANPKDLTQMRMSLEWADTINTPIDNTDPAVPTMTVVEQLLLGWGAKNFIMPENEPVLSLGYNMKSLDWRISTTLGLYVTEALARAFQDGTKGSMLYRQAPDVKQSYIRYMDNLNEPNLKEGWREGKLDWVEMRDPRWNWSNLSISHESWDVWAPQNGYTEMRITVQRNGYGYGFGGLPIKLATAVLTTYLVLVLTHIVSICIGGQTYRGYSNMGEMLALAWNSAPARELKNTSAGIEKLRTWKHVVKVEECADQHLQLAISDAGNEDRATRPSSRVGIEYS